MFVYVLLIVLALAFAANAQYNTTLGQSACNAFNNNCVQCIQYANGDNKVDINKEKTINTESIYLIINLSIICIYMYCSKCSNNIGACPYLLLLSH